MASGITSITVETDRSSSAIMHYFLLLLCISSLGKFRSCCNISPFRTRTQIVLIWCRSWMLSSLHKKIERRTEEEKKTEDSRKADRQERINKMLDGMERISSVKRDEIVRMTARDWDAAQNVPYTIHVSNVGASDAGSVRCIYLLLRFMYLATLVHSVARCPCALCNNNNNKAL